MDIKKDVLLLFRRREENWQSITMFNYPTMRFTVRGTFRDVFRIVLITDWREHLSALVYVETPTQ